MAPSSPPGLCPDPLTHALPRPTAGVSIWWFRSLGWMPVFRLTLTHPTLAPGNPGTSPRTPLWWVPPCPCWQPSWSASKSAPLPASRTPAAPRTQLLCPEKRTEHSQPRDGRSLSSRHPLCSQTVSLALGDSGNASGTSLWFPPNCQRHIVHSLGGPRTAPSRDQLIPQTTPSSVLFLISCPPAHLSNFFEAGGGWSGGVRTHAVFTALPVVWHLTWTVACVNTDSDDGSQH